MYWKGSSNFRNPTTSLIKNSVFQYGSLPSDLARCCKGNTCLYPPWPQYKLSLWDSNGGTSLLSLPGASATQILENVVLRGSPGDSSWLRTGVRAGGQVRGIVASQHQAGR